ncbi:MAG: alcohol dehydrogenase catalytic domain-containing protein, partial [Planctomycetota bacterium]
MQALIRYGTGAHDVRLDDVPEPQPGPHEVKIEVKAAGVCGTDIHGHPSVVPPVILGHELAGVIAEVGTECAERRVGERVTSETTKSTCGRCRYCRQGPVSLCIDRRGMASTADGCFARYVCLPESSVHPLPPDVSFEAGALTEPLACATHAAFEQGGVAPGEVIVVLGPGPLGLLVARCCALVGARVIVAGTAADDDRLRLADAFGADRTVDVESEDLPAFVRSITDGYGADTAFECSGAPAAVRTGLACLRKRGRFVQAGMLAAGGNAIIEFATVEHARSWAARYSRWLHETAPGLDVVVVHRPYEQRPLAWALRALQIDVARAKQERVPGVAQLGLSVTASCSIT